MKPLSTPRTNLSSIPRSLTLAFGLVGAVSALTFTGACTEEDSDKKTTSSNKSDGGGDPIYRYHLSVYSPEGTLEYNLLRNELDLNVSVNDLKTAREFPGYTGIATIGGYVVSGDSETPFATKWEIGDDFSWKQVGNKLNFTDYFTDDEDGMNFYFQSINGSDMYFFYGADRTSRVHWNVDEWKIMGAYQDTKLPSRAGWSLNNNGNRTGMRDYEGPVVWPFTLVNEENWLPSDTSWLAVYDEKTHKEKRVIEVPCPGIAQSTKDEQGNLYFSTTFTMPTLHLYGKAPAPCVVKVKANGTLDKSFEPNDLTEWTGGFYGVNFRYLGNGKASANVLHHDRLTDVDWTGDVDPEVEVKISGQWTDDGFLPEDPTLWELHLIDLEEGTSEIIKGFKPEHDVSFYTIYIQVEDHTFIAVQEDEGNTIYELDMSTARVKSVGKVAGELWTIERIR